MKRVTRKQIVTKLAVLAVALIGVWAASLSYAATPDTLYSYSFDTPTVTSPVPNTAAANANVPLTLQGTWSKTTFGIRFDGNTSGLGSIGVAKPATGNVVSIAADKAVGASVKFTYEAPKDGKKCLGDSRNITQIGRFGTNLSQIKLQYSNCGKFANNVYPECRMVGANSTVADVPMSGTQPLVNGATYIVKCVKAPDPASGKVALQLRTVRVDPVGGNQVTTDNFTITRSGLISTTAALSVGNKAPLPAGAANTDQFVGEIAKVAYCASASTQAAMTCLDTEIPETTGTPNPDPDPNPDPAPPPPPPPAPVPTIVEFITNKSIEADLTGWTGVYNATSTNTRVAGGYEGAFSLRSINKASAAGAIGFIDKPRWLDGSAGKMTAAGKVYTGSLWVKSDAVGLKVNLYLREMTSSGATAGSKTFGITTTSTGWVQLKGDYTATSSGNSIGYYVYASNAAAGKGFNADLLSLTTPN